MHLADFAIERHFARWEVEPRRIASIRVRIWATLLGGVRGTRTLDEVEWSCAGDFA